VIDLDRIHRGMDVLTSDGHRLGTVRELVGHIIFLDSSEADSGGKDVSVPLIWILSTDEVVRLAKSREQVQREWQAGPGTGL